MIPSPAYETAFGRKAALRFGGTKSISTTCIPDHARAKDSFRCGPVPFFNGPTLPSHWDFVGHCRFSLVHSVPRITLRIAHGPSAAFVERIARLGAELGYTIPIPTQDRAKATSTQFSEANGLPDAERFCMQVRTPFPASTWK